MIKHIRIVVLCSTLVCVLACSNTTTPSGEPVCFTQQVQPLIDGGCAKSGCHDSTTKAHNITLITYTEIASVDELLEAINGHESDELMPPLPWKKLNDSQIETISRWVQQGKQNSSCDPLPLPDTATVSYSTHIAPIINVYCIGCHATQASGSGPLLNTYEQVRYETEFASLLPCVAHEVGYTSMPPGRTRVTEYEVELIRRWSKNGFRM